MKAIHDPYHEIGIHKEHLSSVIDFDWLIKSIALGEHMGRQSSNRLGAGLEFSQYRPYSQGDDLRQLDWKMYARTDRFFIKQSEVDANISVTFIPDQSASMNYEENGWSKRQYCKLMMGLLGYYSAANGDKYGISGIKSNDLGLLPGMGPKHWNRFLHQIIALQETPGFSAPNIPKLTDKELFVVFTDLYEQDRQWSDFIKKLKSRRNEVIVFHLMGQKEMTLDFSSTTLFHDLETNQEVKVEPKGLRASYLSRLQTWTSQLKKDFTNEGVDYVPINMSEPISAVLQKFIWHRKKLM